MSIIIIIRELSIIYYYHIIVTRIIINYLYGLIMDPHNNQLPLGLIAELVGYTTLASQRSGFAS